MEKGKALLRFPPFFVTSRHAGGAGPTPGIDHPLRTQLSYSTVLLASCPRRSAEQLQGRGCVLFTAGPYYLAHSTQFALIYCLLNG